MAKDPYQYFRIEARELLEGLTQGIIALEKSDASKELVSRLLRLAHTFKGAARVVKQSEVSELAHRIEDVLTPYRDADGPIPKAQINRVLELVDACSELLKPVLSPLERERTPAASPASEEPFTSVRVEIGEMDTLLYDLADVGVHVKAMHQETVSLEQIAEMVNLLVNELALLHGSLKDNGKRPAAANDLRSLAEKVRTTLRRSHHSLRAGLERAHRDLGNIRERASDLRLLPAQAIFAVLERTVRDTAESLKKRVVFEVVGGEHRLDAHVLLALRDALTHILRNAAAHGIETESERAATGKPAEGRVRLQIHKRGQRIHFLVEDDGRGIDIAAIRRSVIERKLVSRAQAEALGLAEATQLLFQGGLSTAPAVSEVMGRGIGLDVVRSTVARLKGEVSLRSEPGRGTSVEIIVPVSMESMDVLAVVACETTALIPFAAVSRTVRLLNKDLARSANGAMLIWEDQALPFLPLAEILSGRRRQGPLPRAWTALVIQARGARAAIGVDGLEGVRNVVVRPLPTLSGPIPLVAGATLDGAGNPQLVLNPDALVAAVRSETGPATEPAAIQQFPVLVVDDSLTTRMLEQSILETAGYQVDLAISGEEALEKARHKRYAVFVVDVEMPGMNGFELLERFRADPVLHRVPAVMVTSRNAAEDRQRAEQAGARAYIVKSEFDEGHLLRTIRGLIGEASS